LKLNKQDGKGYDMNESHKLFSRPVETLEDCLLTNGMSEGDAAVLGAMLGGIDPWLALGISPKALAGYLLRDDPALRRYVVRVGDFDEIIGVICIRYPWLRGPYIELLGLSDGYQGKGLGWQILRWVESEARREARNLWVVTSSFNHKAQDFYRRHGFYEIGPLKGLVSRNADEILFRKDWD
jgi:ribosomal protein S18 acetylase RimI-like enzyme